MMLRVVDKDSYLLGANLSSSVAKDKQHGVNHVGLSTSIGTNYRAETLQRVCVCVCVMFMKTETRVCICDVCVYVYRFHEYIKPMCVYVLR